MVSELEGILSEHSGSIELIIVDEGHHMAAPSYREIIETPSLRVLVVTATPIRTDGNDIHIDEIAYTTSYRNLINLGVLVEPSFLDPVTLDWKDSETLQNLADYVIDQTESVFQKTLIVVSQKDYAEKLGDLILDKLDGTFGHPLDAQDVCWVHGEASSNGSKPVDFLEQFRSKDRAVLVATNQLIAEGFDDPKVDSVVVTYPSKSIGHLMQVAGRALRQAPDKKNAYIVQCLESELSYHIEERWLYEDISDFLRPHLEDCKYRNITDLKRQIAQKLDDMNVEKNVQSRILSEIQHVNHGDSCSLLLTGMPYAGSSSNFSSYSKWGAILSTEKNRNQFTKVFNDFSDLYLMVKDHNKYLEKYMHCDTSRGSEWKSYIDMLSSMYAAHKELSNQGLTVNNRNYIHGHGTSWLTYVTYRYFQDVPTDLETFLENSVNRYEVVNEYIKNSKSWHLVIKIQLPLGGTLAFLLDETQAEWLDYQRNNLKKRLLSCRPEDSFSSIASWRMALKEVPLHALILERISDLLSDETYQNHSMQLK